MSVRNGDLLSLLSNACAFHLNIPAKNFKGISWLPDISFVLHYEHTLNALPNSTLILIIECVCESECVRESRLNRG